MPFEAINDPVQGATGENGEMTPADCIQWLEAKYARHGELEDQASARIIKSLCERLDGWYTIEARIHGVFLRRFGSDAWHDAILEAAPPPGHNPNLPT